MNGTGGSGRCSLLTVGDIYLDRPDPVSAFARVRALIARHDLVFANLEAPVSARTELPPWASKFPLRMPPSMIDGLARAGFHVLSLANNHTMDYGAPALLDTVEAVRGAGIATCGAGADLAEAEAPAVVERNGLRVAFVAFQATDHDRPDMSATPDRPGLNRLRLSPYYPTPHVDPLDLTRLDDCIGRAREVADTVVVSCHWGLAGSESLVVPQRAVAARAVAAGAALVVGHHTHVPQAVSVVDGCPVIYGLGNFAFDWTFPHFVPERLVAEFTLDRDGVVAAGVRPAVADPDVRVLALDDPASATTCRDVLARSAEEGTELVPDGDRLSIPVRR